VLHATLDLTWRLWIPLAFIMTMDIMNTKNVLNSSFQFFLILSCTPFIVIETVLLNFTNSL
jgi:hypothetical protein